MLFLYSIALFLSSALLFWVQPIYAKMLLPILGGTPAVWNTCLFFFQATLLAGYAYAHAAIGYLGLRRQAFLHFVILLSAVTVLPITISKAWVPPTEHNPIPWVLMLLITTLGLPFFVLSTHAPMLQKWFSHSDHPSAADPYFLYAASNLGSVIALLSYPTLVEPNLTLQHQARLWTGGYVLVAVLILGCALALRRSPAVKLAPVAVPPRSEPRAGVNSDVPTWRQKILWLLWSFVPSSLLLGVTTYLTTNITPFPLFWIIPLTIYLLTFVVAFAQKQALPQSVLGRMLPFSVLMLVLTVLLRISQPFWLLFLVHLLNFLVISLVCHTHIAKSRPPTAFLTNFFLWISIGGVLGGFLNALIAPVIFTADLEYKLVLILACLVQPAAELAGPERYRRQLDFALPLTLGVMTFALLWAQKGFQPLSGMAGLIVLFGLPVVLCFSFRRYPRRFGLGILTLLLAHFYAIGGNEGVLHSERTFYGLHRVVMDDENNRVMLFHGNIKHGQQSTLPESRGVPLAYYYPSGPIGQVFATLSRENFQSPVALVGLGAGALACYGQPRQPFDFYEIDPAIKAIAENPRFFTYLRDCPPQVRVILGDARFSLEKAPANYYGLIILDAFSADAIPVHLLTREAVGLYLDKLTSGGLLAFHISNAFLNLEPVLCALARELELACLTQGDGVVSEDEKVVGKITSHWTVMGRRAEDLKALAEDPRWKFVSEQNNAPVWTDDFSNVLGTVRWK